MHKVTQAKCNAIAKKLNERSKKRYNYKTSEDFLCLIPMTVAL
jgi:IS30 family transposase